MSYASEARKTGREHIYIIEIEADYCVHTYGLPGCGVGSELTLDFVNGNYYDASQSGDLAVGEPCYNTLQTCQSPCTFLPEQKVYRFCTNRHPLPEGLEAIPSLKNVSIAPSEIDVGGGLGVRASVSIALDDHPASDLGIDKYLDERSYIALERGTYWTKWRARNPYYQNRKMRVLSGYLDDGEYDPDNFVTRHYIIESVDVTGGQCRITGKDTLKLADNDKAQAPKASTGELVAAITTADTSAALTPAGVGDSEYPASGFIRIGSEVMGFTRTGDNLTITRGEYNTEIAEHDSGDTVQLCLTYDNQVDDIIADLLTTYANVDPAFIPYADWAAEADAFLRGNYKTIITKPVGVKDLLKELGQQAPHSLYWDERTQTIRFMAVKPPPSSAPVLNMESNLVAGSFSTKDERKRRVSTVFVYYGQINPTEDLDKADNYRKTYVRANTESINRYGTNEIKTIYSRWIPSTSNAQARVLAAKIGRRYGDVPRAIGFSLDAKDSNVWAGQSIRINHRDIVDPSGEPVNTTVQILSAEEQETYNYKALEYIYDNSLPEDEGGGEPGVDLLILDSDNNNVSIRELYDNEFAVAPDASTKVKLIIEGVATIGSISTSQPALTTGSWPAGAEVELEVRGRVLGMGGNAGDGDSVDGQDGGVAISMQYDITLNNLGLIGGGAGGGGGARDTQLSPDAKAGGGGGAGRNAGAGGGSYYNDSGLIQVTSGQDGSPETGGNGGIVQWSDGGFTYEIRGGKGGNIGQSGSAGYADPSLPDAVVGLGGSAGNAIITNGNAITYDTQGDIRGSVN